MKNLILLISMLGQLALAGNGSGTLSPEMGKSAKSTMNYSTIDKGIVFYQGEINNNIYFQYGKPVGNKWKIEQYKIDTEIPTTGNNPLIDAIKRSEETKNWSLVKPYELLSR